MKPNVADLLNNPVPVKKAELYDRLRDILALGWQEMPANVALTNPYRRQNQRIHTFAAQGAVVII